MVKGNTIRYDVREHFFQRKIMMMETYFKGGTRHNKLNSGSLHGLYRESKHEAVDRLQIVILHHQHIIWTHEWKWNSCSLLSKGSIRNNWLRSLNGDIAECSSSLLLSQCVQRVHLHLCGWKFLSNIRQLIKCMLWIRIAKQRQDHWIVMV